MAITSVAACNACDNIIFPGDVVTYLTKGIFGGLNETGGTDIIGTDDSPVLHYCEECSQAVGESLMSDALAYDEPLPDPEDFDDDGGWGVTAEAWAKMLERADFLHGTHPSRESCRADECLYAPDIKSVLAQA